MEFGYFAQVFVPDAVAQERPGYEQRRLLDNLELSVHAEEFGFKYVWASEHHFLRQYSHMSSPEVFLSFVASRTSRMTSSFIIGPKVMSTSAAGMNGIALE